MNKKVIIFIFIFSLSLGVRAQSAKYIGIMSVKLSLLDTVTSKRGINALFFDFQRIADIEKKQWLPYYYMAYCKIRLASGSTDKETIDDLLDEAKTYCAMADSLSKDNSEVMCLKSRIALSKIPVNMIERGPKYSVLSRIFAENAVKKDPNNPRAYLTLSMYYLYTPNIFGGDKDKAQSNLVKAKSLFKAQKKRQKDDLTPNWGDKLTENLLLQLN